VLGQHHLAVTDQRPRALTHPGHTTEDLHAQAVPAHAVPDDQCPSAPRHPRRRAPHRRASRQTGRARTSARTIRRSSREWRSSGRSCRTRRQSWLPTPMDRIPPSCPGTLTVVSSATSELRWLRCGKVVEQEAVRHNDRRAAS
jgi:hypothetical protein